MHAICVMDPQKVQQGNSAGSFGCSICQDLMQEGEETVRLPGCRHLFHWSCLFEWFSRRLTCPNCKLDVYDVIAGQADPRPPRPELQQQQQQQQQPSSQAPRQSLTAGEGERTATPAVDAATTLTAPTAPYRLGSFTSEEDVQGDTADGWMDVDLGPPVGARR